MYFDTPSIVIYRSDLSLYVKSLHLSRSIARWWILVIYLKRWSDHNTIRWIITPYSRCDIFVLTFTYNVYQLYLFIKWMLSWAKMEVAIELQAGKIYVTFYFEKNPYKKSGSSFCVMSFSSWFFCSTLTSFSQGLAQGFSEEMSLHLLLLWPLTYSSNHKL